jgi:hypothetical protein
VVRGWRVIAGCGSQANREARRVALCSVVPLLLKMLMTPMMKVGLPF